MWAEYLIYLGIFKKSHFGKLKPSILNGFLKLNPYTEVIQMLSRPIALHSFKSILNKFI